MSSERPPSSSPRPPSSTERPMPGENTATPPRAESPSPAAAPPVPAPVAPVGPAEPQQSRTEVIGETVGRWARIIRFVLIVVLTFLVALFVLRNFDDVRIDYVFGDTGVPLAVIILLSVAVGMVLGPLLYWLLWSRHRPSHRHR